MALQNLSWGLSQPFAGAVADRYGARGVAAMAAIAYGAGLAVAASARDGLTLALGLGLLAGVGQAGTAYAVVLGAVARAVPPAHRSEALGLTSAAGSLGMLAIVPADQALIAHAGWSTAFACLAVAALAMALLAMGLPGRSAAYEAPPYVASVPAVGSPFATRTFWLASVGFAACGFQLAFISTYIPAIVLRAGSGPNAGAMALAAIGLCNVAGTYACGILGQRYPKRIVLAAIYLLRTALIVTFFTLPITVAGTVAFGAAMGLLWTATVPLTSGLIADVFGTARLGLLFGSAYLAHQVGAAAGAWLGGASFDATGSYAAAWTTAAALGVCAAALTLPISERREASMI